MLISKISAGATFEVSKTYTTYPASEYDAELIVHGPETLTITATKSNNTFQFKSTSSETAILAEGLYSYVIHALKDGEKYLAESGQVVVEKDLSTATKGLSSDEIILANITKTLEGSSSKDVAEYEIEGRKLKRIPLAELDALKSKYEWRVAKAKRRAASKSIFSKIKVGTRNR